MFYSKFVTLIGMVGIRGAAGCGAESGVGSDESVAAESMQLLSDGIFEVVVKNCAAVSFSSGINSTACRVPTGYVLIGGGGQVLTGPTEAGAYLQASMPSGDNWIVKARDHSKYRSNYRIQASVIGLKVVGVSEATLRQKIKVTTSTSSPPERYNFADAYPPAGYVALGGGAEAISAGGHELLVASKPSPSGGGWRAVAKEHIISDPGTAKAYVISMQSFNTDIVLPQGPFLHVGTSISKITSTSSAGYQSISLRTTGTVPCGAGASADFRGGGGRLLTAMMPTDLNFGNKNFEVFAASKNIESSGVGTTTAYGVSIFNY